jgi:hypothetical protein
LQFGDALGFIEPIDIVPESLVLEREFSDGVPARVKIFLESGQAGELRFDFGYLLVNETKTCSLPIRRSVSVIDFLNVLKYRRLHSEPAFDAVQRRNLHQKDLCAAEFGARSRQRGFLFALPDQFVNLSAFGVVFLDV